MLQRLRLSRSTRGFSHTFRFLALAEEFSGSDPGERDSAAVVVGAKGTRDSSESA